MKKIKILSAFLILSMLFFTSCKKQLEVRNPNQPGLDAAQTESGLLSYAQGSTYISGFNDLKYGDGVLGSTFFTGVIAIHDLMGDVVGMEAANVYGNQIGCPDKVILDDGSEVLNPNFPQQQKDFLRQVNTNANQGNNPLYYEWAFMYNLIRASNSTLYLADGVTFSGNADTRKKTLQAWCYWWKGYAYARIGSMYYAGLINDYGGPISLSSPGTNGNYVSHDAIITESNKNLDMAASILDGLSEDDDYDFILSSLIPDIFLTGKGGLLSPDMWKRNINTLKARNILVNKKTSDMTSADWQSVLTLVDDGVKEADYVFTARADDLGTFMSASSGNLPANISSSTAGGNTYKVSERLIQDYKPGDKRLENNYTQTDTWFGNSDRGNAFNTRYTLVDGGNGIADVPVISNTTSGEFELYMAVTYEENELMKAEAKINDGDIEGGLSIIDDLRNDQGAALPAVAGTGLSLTQAKEELRSERRIELAYRGLSFYDARRWGIIYDISKGGGRTGCIVVDNDGVLNTNATINYNYRDYWDVPDTELAYNPPVDGSAAVVNPD